MVTMLSITNPVLVYVYNSPCPTKNVVSINIFSYRQFQQNNEFSSVEGPY